MESGTEDCFSESSSDECYPVNNRSKLTLADNDDCSSNTISGCSPHTELSAPTSPEKPISKGKLKLKICFPLLKKNMKRRPSNLDTRDDDQFTEGGQGSSKTKYLKKVKAAKYVRRPEGCLSEDQSSDDIIDCRPIDVLREIDDGKDRAENTAQSKSVESLVNFPHRTVSSNSIMSPTLRDLWSTLEDAEALDASGHLQSVSKSKLTVKLVMAVVNVLNFPYEDICLWVHQSKAKEFSSLTDRYSLQFDCYKIMHRLVCSNIGTANGQELLRLVGISQYKSPQKIHSWQIIFREIPNLLQRVSLFGSIQEQSNCLNDTYYASDVLLDDRSAPADCSGTIHNSSAEGKDILSADFVKRNSYAEEDLVSNANDPKRGNEGARDTEYNQSALPTRDGMIDFLSKIELLTVLPSTNTVCESDILNRMLRIEQHLMLTNAGNRSHPIEDQCDIEEANFLQIVSQLAKALKFIKEKDTSTISGLLQKEKSLKDKPLKEKLMFLYQSNRSKSKKISFLRSQNHLLKRTVDEYKNHLEYQKRARVVFKRKMLSMETIIGHKKISLLEPSNTQRKLSEPQSKISSRETVRKAIKIPLQRNSTLQKLEPTASNCNLISTVSESERTVRLFSQQALASTRMRPFDGSFNSGGRSRSEVATQCDLIFENNVVMKLPKRSADGEVDAVKQDMINLATEIYKTDGKRDVAGSLTNFKLLVDNLILLEVLFHQKSTRTSTNFQLSTNVSCAVTNETENILNCVGNNDILNTNINMFKKDNLFSACKTSSAKLCSNVDVSSLDDPRYWEHLDKELLSKVISGLSVFLSRNTDPWNVMIKQNLVEVICDRDAQNREVNDLCMKLNIIREQHEEQLQQTRVALCVDRDEKVKALEDKLISVQRKHGKDYNKNVQQVSETNKKYSAIIKQHEIAALEFKSYQNNVIANEKIIAQKLDSVYYSLHTSLYTSVPSEYSTVRSPQHVKLHAKDALAKVSCVLDLCDQVSHFRTKLEEYKADCARFADVLLSIDSLSATIEDLSTSLCSVKQRQRNLKGTADTLTERYEVTLQNYEKEKIKLDLQNEELLLSNAKLTAAGRQIGVLVSSLETQEMALMYERENVASKLTSAEERCAEKEAQLQELQCVVENEQWKTSGLRKQLDDANSEISKLAVLWELLEVNNSKVTLDLSKTSNSTETTSITAADMSMLEHLTQWAPNVPGSNDAVNMSLSSDVTQLCPCESSTSPSNFYFKDSASVSSTVALESNEDISSLAEFVFGNGQLSDGSSPVSSSTVQASAESITL